MSKKLIVPVSFDDIKLLVNEYEFNKHVIAYNHRGSGSRENTDSHVTELFNGCKLVSYRAICDDTAGERVVWREKNSNRIQQGIQHGSPAVLQLVGYAEKILEVCRVIELRAKKAESKPSKWVNMFVEMGAA